MPVIPDQFADGVPLKGVRAEHLADGLILPSHLSTGIKGLVGDITAINGDDPAAAGASGRLADAAHQHSWTTEAPIALTKTETNTEGSSANGVKGDHGHSTANLPWGLLATPTKLTSDSSDTSGGTELDLAIDQTITITSGRWAKLSFTPRNLLGTVQQDIFEVRFRENGTVVMRFQGQVHEVTAHIDMGIMSHTYQPTAGSRTFDVTLIRISGTGVARVKAGADFPATFTVEDPGKP